MEDQGNLYSRKREKNSTETPKVNLLNRQTASMARDLGEQGQGWSIREGPETSLCKTLKARFDAKCNGKTSEGFKQRNNII